MKKKVSNKKEDKILQKIENLALITDKGFDRVQKQFEGVHKKLDEHDKNFESIHKEIENLALITGKGFEGVYKKLDEHDKKFESIDRKFNDVDGQFKVVINELMRVGDEVKDIKGTMMDLVHMSADQDKENRKIVFRLDHLENRAVARWNIKN